MKISKHISIGLLCLVVGVAAAISPVREVWQEHHVVKASANPFTVKSSKPSQPSKPLITGQPDRIQIPSVAIDIPVINGYYNQTTKGWTLTDYAAQYATITPLPNNESGNTFIYGHNRWSVFYKLLKIQPGDEATVYTTNGHKFVYQFKASVTTNPGDDSLFTYKGPSILTLQTCSGLWYQNRQLFTFNLVEAT